ncbi:MAG: hypothetical protein ACTSXP_03760 [Promethearchaeota archaeon]
MTREKEKVKTFKFSCVPVHLAITFLLFLSAGIISLIFFTTSYGRHVPTGSVLGFESVSYFYVSGFPLLILCLSSIPYLVGQFKAFEISRNDDDALIKIIEKLWSLKKKNIEIPMKDLVSYCFKRFPGTKSLILFFFFIPYFSLNLRLIVSNFLLPYTNGISKPAVIELVCLVLVMTGVILVLARPNIMLELYCTTMKVSLKFPRSLGGFNKISKKIQEILSAVAVEIKEDCNPNINKNHYGKNAGLYRQDKRRIIAVIVAIVWFGFGLWNLYLIKTVSIITLLNEGSAWVSISLGIILILEIFNQKNMLHRNIVLIQAKSGTASKKRARVLHFWLIFIFVAGIISFGYPLTFAIKARIYNGLYPLDRLLALLLLTLTFTCTIIWRCTIKNWVNVIEKKELGFQIIIHPFRVKIKPNIPGEG